MSEKHDLGKNVRIPTPEDAVCTRIKNLSLLRNNV